MATQANGSRRQIAYIPEVTYNVVPSTPQTQIIDYVDFGLEANYEQLEDDTVNGSRQSTFNRAGNVTVEGDIVVRLTPDNYDELLQAVTMGTWAVNTLKIGTVGRSFSFEEGLLDLNQFRTFSGCVASTMSMEVNTEELVSATFGFMGANATAWSGTSLDTTPTAVTSKPKFYHEGGTFSEGGVNVAYFSQITYDLTNNVSGNRALGTVGFRNVTPGKLKLTGSVTGLAEDMTIFNKLKNSTSSSLGFTLAASAETLNFTFPSIKYTNAVLNSSGDAGVTFTMQFEALYDSTAGTTLTITRV